jgi:hypothetical protein
MDLGTMTIIFISGAGALIAGMAALIKTMILSRMAEDRRAAEQSQHQVLGRLETIQDQISGLTREHYRLVNRVVAMETLCGIRQRSADCPAAPEEVR